MLNLHYIIVGSLPKKQRCYLEQNLSEDGAERESVQIIVLDMEKPCGTEKSNEEQTIEMKEGMWKYLQNFPAQESIFISGDYTELQSAILLHMATLGYLSKKERARYDTERFYDNKENIANILCSNTDMWAEGFEEIDLRFLRRVYERHHKIPWTILTTDRCVVKEFSMEYLEDLFELYAGEGMTDYMEPLYPYEQEKEYQEAYITNMYGFYGYGMWIVCDKQTGKLIGRAGIEHREELGGELELGYAIGVPYQRKGYATEVCTAILAYAKEELLQPSVCCLIEEGNSASEHFAKKLGFRMEGILTVDEKRMKKYAYVF